jgi:tetratricopeptide (TPR) repeat protein
MLWIRRLSHLAALLLVFSVACKRKPTEVPFDPNDPGAAAAALRAHLEEHPDDVDARRDLAHLEWIWLAEPDAALGNLTKIDPDPASLLSRVLIGQGRDDAAMLADSAYALIEQAMVQDDPFVDAAAHVAARALQRSHGDRPGDDARFSAFFDESGSKLGSLPFSARQPLLSLRASIARRLGEPYEGLFERQGCVQAWEATAVQGRLGDYELPGVKPGAFTPDPAAAVVPLSCVVRVWNPTPRSGVRHLRTTLRTESDAIELDISGQEAMRVWLDGTLIHRTDRTDQYAARRSRITVPVQPGAHVLELATAIPRDKAWVLVRAVDGEGRGLEPKADGTSQGAGLRGEPQLRRPPWPEPTAADGPLAGPIHAPLRTYLAMDAALADGDTDTAERYLGGLDEAEGFAMGWMMRASFERNDPSRPRTNSASREQSALETALERDPKLEAARRSLLQLLLRRGDDAEASAMLSELAEGSLRTVDGELLRHQIHRAAGEEHLARAALDRAKAIDDEHCSVLRFQRAQARDIRDVKREDTLTEALGTCSGSLETRAMLAQTRADWDEARTLWQEALRRKPDDLDALDALAHLETLRGDTKAARGHLEAMAALVPMRASTHIALADLSLAEGDRDGARTRVKRALEQLPFSNGLRRLGEDLGLEDDLMAYRVDGLAKLAAYQASGVTYEGAAEALVLDRSVARVYEGGGLRQIVHIVVHLLSKEALDRYGELETPPGAALLTLRSMKPDGELFEPELVPGKDGVSLRHLEIGDFVEYEYVIEQPPSGVVPDYVDVSTFRFQSFDVPYHRSELWVLAPPSIDLKIDRRNTPPQAEVSEVRHGGQTLRLSKFGVDQMPRLGVEPGTRSILEEVPNVRIYTAVDVEAWMQSLAASVYYGRRTNPELRAHVRRITRGKETDAEKLRALWTWVVENIDDGGDLSSPSTATFATRRGNRLVLLATMLDLAGVDHELWLARNRHGPKSLPGGHPMIENYDAPMLAVNLPGRETPMMVMTVSKVMPMGYLPPGYGDAAALRLPVRPTDAGGEVRVPAVPPEFADARRWDLDIRTDVTGEATVTGTVTLTGGEAIAWRQALREIDADRIREVFQQAELGWLRGSELVELDIEGADVLEAPLVLAFKATTASLGVVQNGALLVRSDVVPLNIGAPYVALPQRMTGMVVPYAPVHEATVRFEIADGRLAELPEPASVQGAFGTFARKVEGRAGGSALTLELRSTLKTGVVEPHDYPKLAKFVRSVEAASAASLRAAP